MDDRVSVEFGDQLKPVTVTAQPKMARNFCKSHPCVAFVLALLFLLMASGAIFLGVLFQRVLNLEQKLIEVSSIPVTDNMRMSNWNGTSPTQPPHKMLRRDAPGQMDDVMEPFSYSSASETSVLAFGNFIHIAGSKRRDYSQGQWITWNTENIGMGNSLLLQHMPFKHDKFIIIPKPGFYYVYTQLTHGDARNLSNFFTWTGHEIVRDANCGQGQSQVLVSSWITQPQNLSAADSNYIGGVFYLYTNDRIGVRVPANGGINFKVSPSSSLCFFGAYMVAPDPSYDSRVDDTCCCLGV